jgi:hypothetical protein
MKGFFVVKKYLRFIFKSFCLILGLGLMFGCAKYDPQHLDVPRGKLKQKEGVVVAKKALTEEECRTYFDRRLLKRGYQPVQIYVKNETDKTYVLDSYNIGMPLEPVKKVMNSMHRNVPWKATKYFLIGGVIWGTLEGIMSYDVNRKIDDDLKERSINENDIVQIKPYGVVNRVVFVAKNNYDDSNFSLKLLDTESKKELKFDV